jgi:hypothetical protein
MLPQDFAVNQKVVHPTDGEGRVTFVDPMLQRLKLKYPEEKFERMYNFYLPNGSVSPILLDIIPFVKAKKHPTPTEVLPR